MQLRSYQQQACDAALAEMRQSVSPCLIDAAPAAGKSYMIAYVAGKLNAISGKRVLCLAPNAELVRQNFNKFLLTGEKASIFSASAGVKSTRNVVVFATPVTVKNSISRFKKEGPEGYCAVVVDESHGMTPTIREIIDEMRKANPNLRVLGLSGTPYTMKGGYIFKVWPDGRVNGDEVTRDPYFVRCVYRVSARQMLDEKFITPMRIGAINTGSYDTSGVVLLPNGTLQPDTVERAFVGHGRKTAAIVADVLDQSCTMPGGVMYFAATVRHAEEILASLPPGNSAMVTGTRCVMFGKDEKQDKVIKAYRDQKFRHLVSVGQLTTGFDVSHTGTIALLRYTESPALLQQILGRAWRLDDAKSESLLLDYAENVERHFPDGDIYNPNIKAGSSPGPGEPITAECPDCGYGNEFSVHPDYKDYRLDQHGYCLDTFGERIESDFGPVAGHYGRRCFGQTRTGPKGEYERCNYRWTGKDCPECGEKNDIAARFCYVCKAEIVNPNDKLIADFKALKRDPTVPQTDPVLSMACKEGVSAKGNRTMRVNWVTPYRGFSTWFMPDLPTRKAQTNWQRFEEATKDGPPATITYVKETASDFYRILSYDRPADEEPEGANIRKRAS